jgi:hypothetical protein
VACGGNGGFWGGNFGGHVAENNREYGGLPAHIASAMHLIDQRIGNARGGLGFLTSTEILAAGRATRAHAWIFYNGAVYDASGVVWGDYVTMSDSPMARSSGGGGTFWQAGLGPFSIGETTQDSKEYGTFGIGVGSPMANYQAAGRLTSASKVKSGVALSASGGFGYIANYSLLSYDENGFHFISSAKPDGVGIGNPQFSFGPTFTICTYNCGPPPGRESVVWTLRALHGRRSIFQ